MIIYNFEECLQNFNVQANCILSLKIPNNEDFNHVISLKKQMIRNKINNNDFNFYGAHLLNLEITDIVITEDLNLSKSVISGNVILKDIKVNGKINLDFAKIGGEVLVLKSKLEKINMSRIFINKRILISDSNVSFISADGDYAKYYYGNWNLIILKINKYFLSLFNKNFNPIKDEYKIRCGFDIVNSKMGIISISRLNVGEKGFNGILMDLLDISVYAVFVDCVINGNIWIHRVNVEWDLEFIGSKIKSAFDYELSNVNGKLSFDRSIFVSPYAQENASREAKRIWDKLGDKDKTDDYYFKEMEAKRRKKFLKHIEWLLIQLPFGYGVKFYRVIFTFIFFILVFAVIFWLGKGIEGADSFLSNLYVSALTALKLGYSGYQPVDGNFQLATTIEAIGGAFLWSISIVIFARKFIR